MWTYEGKLIESHDDLHPDCTDFVYVITYEDGRKYIGKKAVRAVRKRPPLKGKKRNRRILTNLPFINYQGSHATAKELTPIFKQIVYQCSKRKTSSYLEIDLIVTEKAIFKDEYINEHFGTFFSNSLDGLIK